MREGVPIGATMLMRNAVRPFTDKQIEFATTSADQAANREYEGPNGRLASPGSHPNLMIFSSGKISHANTR
jgi:hypothetical protein